MSRATSPSSAATPVIDLMIWAGQAIAAVCGVVLHTTLFLPPVVVTELPVQPSPDECYLCWFTACLDLPRDGNADHSCHRPSPLRIIVHAIVTLMRTVTTEQHERCSQGGRLDVIGVRSRGASD